MNTNAVSDEKLRAFMLLFTTQGRAWVTKLMQDHGFSTSTINLVIGPYDYFVSDTDGRKKSLDFLYKLWQCAQRTCASVATAITSLLAMFRLSKLRDTPDSDSKKRSRTDKDGEKTLEDDETKRKKTRKSTSTSNTEEQRILEKTQHLLHNHTHCYSVEFTIKQTVDLKNNNVHYSPKVGKDPSNEWVYSTMLDFLQKRNVVKSVHEGPCGPMPVRLLDTGKDMYKVNVLAENVNVGDDTKEKKETDMLVCFDASLDTKTFTTKKWDDNTEKYVENTIPYQQYGGKISIYTFGQSPETITDMISSLHEERLNAVGTVVLRELIAFELASDSRGGLYFKGVDVIKSDDTLSLDGSLLPSEQIAIVKQDLDKTKSSKLNKGLPENCGIFLHGPPGSGKTDLSRRMVNHLGRHVIFMDNLLKYSYETFKEVFNASFMRVTLPNTNKLITVAVSPLRDCVLFFDEADQLKVLENRKVMQKRYEQELAVYEARKRKAIAQKEAELTEQWFTSQRLKARVVTSCLPGLPGATGLPGPRAATEEVAEKEEVDTEDENTENESAEKKTSSQSDKQSITPITTAFTPTLAAYNPPPTKLGKKAKAKIDIQVEDFMENTWLEKNPSPIDYASQKLRDDSIRLQQLLTYFDGFIKKYGFVILMTSNMEPDWFDPAWIRPGRAGKHVIYLGGCASNPGMIDIIFHKKGVKCTPDDRRCVLAANNNKGMTTVELLRYVTNKKMLEARAA